MSEAKLTKAQQTLLNELPKRCYPQYAPAKKLVELGLARWSEQGRYELPMLIAIAKQEPTHV